MVRRIVLNNFMSHPHTVIEPAEGLTVLCGPNNCGKSAVVVALQVLCENARGSYMLRHDADAVSVRVETEDDHVFEWRRTSSDKVSYVIDGAVNDRPGSAGDDLLAEMHKLLRLDKVRSVDGKKEFDVHFAAQKSPIFLLDGSGADAATFFAASNDGRFLMQMQARHKENTRDKRRDEALMTQELVALDAQLEQLAGLESLEEQVTALEADHAGLLRQAQAAGELAKRIEAIVTAGREVERAAERSAAMNPLSAPPAMENSAALEMLCTQIRALRSTSELASAQGAALVSIQPPPQVADTAPLYRLIAELKAKQIEAAVHEQRGRLLATLPQAPQLADPASLEAAQTQLRAADAELRSKQTALAAAEKQLAAARKEIERFVADHPTCPTCGGPLNAEQLLFPEAAHVHA